MREALAWSAVLPVAGFAALRAGGLDRVHPLGAAVSFTPHAALAAPAATALAARAGVREAAAVGAAATAVLAAAVVPRAVPWGRGRGGRAPRGAVSGGSPPRWAVSGRSPASGRPFVVVTANLWLGRGDPRALAGLVRRHGADVLCVQELTPDAVGPLLAALGDLLPHRVLVPAFGPDGSGLLSAHPLEALPDDGPPGRHREPRARLAVPGAPPVRVVCVHPRPPVSPRMHRDWERGLAALPHPDPDAVTVLAGDWNATLDHRPLRAVLRRGYADAAAACGRGLRPTWPADRSRPPLTLDHVATDAAVQAHAVRRLPGSDHHAVVARLRLPAR